MELNSIDKYISSNFGGLQSIEYASTSWIDPSSFSPIISSTYNFQQAFSFFPGFDWLKLPVLPKEDRWRETENNSEQGPSYRQEITGITPALRPVVHGEFAKMAQHDFLIRLTDRNGQVWLIGTLDEPLQFSSSGASGQHGGRNRYQIRFSGRTSRPAFGFVPVL